MTPEQAAAVARVRDAATPHRPASEWRISDEDMRALLAALDAAQAAAQAPREVPRLTDADIDKACDGLFGGDYAGLLTLALQRAVARRAEARVRELCGVAP